MCKSQRKAWQQWFCASVSMIVLFCGVAAKAEDRTRYYSYPQPEESSRDPLILYPDDEPAERTVQNAPPANRQPVVANADNAHKAGNPAALAPTHNLTANAQSPLNPPAVVPVASGAPKINNIMQAKSSVVPVASAAAQSSAVASIKPSLGTMEAKPVRAPVVAALVVPQQKTAAPAITVLPVAAGTAQASPGVQPGAITAALPIQQAVNVQVVAPASAGSGAVQNLALLAPASGVLSPATELPTPLVLPAAAPAVNASSADAPKGLSEESKEIVESLPPEKLKPSVKKYPVSIDHLHKTTLEDDNEIKQHEGVGIKISIKRPKTNVSEMLEEAYDALIAGNQEIAISIYKDVLAEQPENKLALFGLATTYHRAGQLQMARPLYGKLLELDPNNIEGLNNFLVLLADESPREALVELDRLEKTHPNFSPLPAQMADIYEKIGDYDKAVQQMSHAIEMSPENLKYRYNMAIILDKKGAWVDAAQFYQQLITASERGEKLPATVDEIQERLTFIRSNNPKGAS